MIVYALVDPRSREIRYVGETIRKGQARLRQHIRTAAEKTTPPVNAWIRSLAQAGLAPEMIEIEAFASRPEVSEGEIYWMEQFRAMGANLLNRAHGGDTRKGWRHSMETRERWCRERRGEKGSNYGKKRTPEMRAAQAAVMRDWIAQNGHPMQGKKHRPESLEKLSKSRRGIIPVMTPEVAAARIEKLRAAWASPEIRKRVSQPGLKNPWAKTVVVDGKPYCYADVARKLGVGQCSCQNQIKKLLARGGPIKFSDFSFPRLWAKRAKEA